MEELGIFSGMEEEDTGMFRSNPPKILRRTGRKYSLLMRLLRSRTKSMIRHNTNDGLGGGSSSGESLSSSAETLKTKPILSKPMDDSALMRFLRSRTELMIQQSTNAGFGGSETLKTEQTPSVTSILMRFLPSRTKPMIQQSTNDGFGGSSSSESQSSPEQTWKTDPTPSVNIEEDVLTIDTITVDELMTADFSDFDGFSELERQFSQENLQLLPTHFPSRDRTQGRNMCREFLRTGRCSMGTMCSFSHQPPVLQPQPEPAPIEVAMPRLFVPSSTLRPPQPQRMPLRQFILQTASPPESPREETASCSGAATSSNPTAATDPGSSTTTTIADTKVDSLPTGDIAAGIPSISKESAALPEGPQTSNSKYSNKEDVGGSGSASPKACYSAAAATTTTADTKADSSPTGDVDTGVPSIPALSDDIPPAQTPKSSDKAAAGGGVRGNVAPTSASSNTISADTKADSSSTGEVGTGIPSISTPSKALPAQTPKSSSSTPRTSTTTVGSSNTTTTAESGATSSSASRASTTAMWSPMDDGIAIKLPGSSSANPPSREDVNRYIDRYLYSPDRPRRRRLPVFQAICPDTDALND